MSKVADAATLIIEGLLSRVGMVSVSTVQTALQMNGFEVPSIGDAAKICETLGFSVETSQEGYPTWVTWG